MGQDKITLAFCVAPVLRLLSERGQIDATELAQGATLIALLDEVTDKAATR